MTLTILDPRTGKNVTITIPSAGASAGMEKAAGE